MPMSLVKAISFNTLYYGDNFQILGEQIEDQDQLPF